jgi:hypothetical protein
MTPVINFSTVPNEFTLGVAPIVTRFMPYVLVACVHLAVIACAQIQWGKFALRARRRVRLEVLGMGALIGSGTGILIAVLGYAWIAGTKASDPTSYVLAGDLVTGIAAGAGVVRWPMAGRFDAREVLPFASAYAVAFFAVACRVVLLVPVVVHLRTEPARGRVPASRLSSVMGRSVPLLHPRAQASVG